MDSGRPDYPNLIVTASAGAGKTHQMTEIIFSLLTDFKKAAPLSHKKLTASSIMGITFTNAAAIEMKERLFRRIEASSPPLTKADILSLLRAAGQVYLGTFDAFFLSLLLAWEQNGYAMADDKLVLNIDESARIELLRSIVEEQDLFSELFIVATLLHTSLDQLIGRLETESDHFTALKEPQLQKERIRTARIKEQTEALYIELQQICQGLLPDWSPFKSFARNVLGVITGKDFDTVARGQDLAKYLQVKDLSELKSLSQEMVEAISDATSQPHQLNLKIQTFKKSLADYFIQKEFLRYQAKSALLAKYHAIRQALKAKQSVYYFAEVLTQLQQILKSSDGPSLYYLTGYARIQQLFVDEFQDSSQANIEILGPLISHILSESGAGKAPLTFFVGDYKQAIYQWRGANQESVQQVLAQIDCHHQIQTQALHENWRSNALLIGFFNNLVKTLYQGSQAENDLQQVPSQKDLSRHHPGEINGFFISSKNRISDGDEASDLSNQGLFGIGAEIIAQFILEKRYERAAGTPADCCILVRKNSDKDQLNQLLSQKGVYTSEIKGIQFLSSVEGVHLFNAALLVFSENFKAEFLQAALPAELFETLQAQKPDFLSRFSKPYLYGALVAFIDDFGLRKEVEGQRVYCREIFISQFLTEAALFFSLHMGDLADFLRYLFKFRHNFTVPAPEQSQCVKISTIHAAKGLQFKHVFVFVPKKADRYEAFFWENGYYHFNQKVIELFRATPLKETGGIVATYEQTLERLRQEEYNLLYVAVTRAKETLHLFVDSKEKENSELVLRLESALDKEIPAAVTEKFTPGKIRHIRIVSGSPFSSPTRPEAEPSPEIPLPNFYQSLAKLQTGNPSEKGGE